jgi:hypothetical protein
MLETILVLIALGGFALISLFFGVDSRDGRDWRTPPTSTHDHPTPRALR